MAPFPGSSSRSLADFAQPSPASTPSTRPSRKGKERAVYTPPVYDFDSPFEDARDAPGFARYKPREGQVKRRKPTKAARAAKASVAGTTKAQAIVVGQPDVVGSGQEGGDLDRGTVSKESKRKRRTKGTASRLEEEALDTPEPSKPSKGGTRRKTGPGKTKASEVKTVRMDVPFDSTDSGSDWAAGADAAIDSDTDEDAHRALTTSPSTRPRRIRLRSAGPLKADDLVSLPSSYASDDDASLPDPSRHLDPSDWAHPHNLPTSVHRRSKKYWRSLEYGTYASAVHDVSVARNDLGRAILEWEELRKLRERQEAEDAARSGATLGRRGSSSGDDENGNADDGGDTPRAGLRRSRRRSGAVQDASQSLAPSLTQSTLDDGPEEEAESQRVEMLLLPSSKELNEIARWPIYPGGADDGDDDSFRPNTLEFEAELRALATEARRRQRQTGGSTNGTGSTTPRARQQKKEKAKSAYGTGGPFPATAADTTLDPTDPNLDSASETELDSDGDSDELLSSSSDTSSQVSGTNADPSEDVSRVASTISSVLLRLLDSVPKVPLPAQDIWSIKARNKALRTIERERREAEDADRAKKEKKAEKAREAGSEEGGDCEAAGGKEPVQEVRYENPDWRHVIAVARENPDVPERVVDALQARLVELYGKPDEQYTDLPLPPIGGKPVFDIPVWTEKKGKYGRKKRKAEPDDEGDGPAETRRGRRPRKRTRLDREDGQGMGENGHEEKSRTRRRLDPAPRPTSSPASSSSLTRAAPHDAGPAALAGADRDPRRDVQGLAQFDLPVPPARFG
ncbi:hypothetical protein JCM10212_002785 [Sporobolomyces blumeae]